MKQLLIYLVILAPITTFIFGCFFYKKLTLPYKLFVIHSFIAFIVECTGHIMHAYKQNNTPIFNFYILINFWITAIPALLFLGKIDKKELATLSAISLLVITNIFSSGIYKFANWGLLICSIYLCVVYFIILYNSAFNSMQQIHKHHLFWLCSGVVVYYGCNIPLMSSLNYTIKKMPSVASALFNLNRILGLFKCLFTMIAIYMCAMNYGNKR